MDRVHPCDFRIVVRMRMCSASSIAFWRLWWVWFCAANVTQRRRNCYRLWFVYGRSWGFHLRLLLLLLRSRWSWLPAALSAAAAASAAASAAAAAAEILPELSRPPNPLLVRFALTDASVVVSLGSLDRRKTSSFERRRLGVCFCQFVDVLTDVVSEMIFELMWWPFLGLVNHLHVHKNLMRCGVRLMFFHVAQQLCQDRNSQAPVNTFLLRSNLFAFVFRLCDRFHYRWKTKELQHLIDDFLKFCAAFRGGIDRELRDCVHQHLFERNLCWLETVTADLSVQEKCAHSPELDH